MKARLIEAACGKITPEYPLGIPYPSGTVIDLADAWRLVGMGCAEPADDECAAKVASKFTPAQLLRARHLHKRACAGITPDDYERYDRGEILGYAPNGSDIPGPNWIDPYEEDEEE